MAPTTTPAPTSPPTTTVNCTDDGSNIVYDAFIIQNDRDSKVMADNGYGKTVLAERLMVSGPKDTWTSGPMDEWTYNSESKVIQAEDGRYVRSTKKGKLKITKRMRYLKGTETPWRWFQWNIVLVREEFTF